MPITLNIIGSGRVGRTLGALLHRAGSCVVQDVLSAEFATAQSAAVFIGAGRAVHRLGDMRPAGLWLLTPPDGAIAAMADALAGADLVPAISCFIAAARTRHPFSCRWPGLARRWPACIR